MKLSYEEVVRAYDVVGFCDGLWPQRSGDCGSRTGLGGPEGPEPDKPSPRCRAPSHIAGKNA